ncbi:MAG: glycosyltransferase family 39 protein, partial [Acidobacteriota bacterium]|nr:glycosyltransferase family 39 protein [Acidobacteriota bacterium]
MRDRSALLLLVAAFALAVFVVDPRGDFPLNDDWGVGFTTFHLVETGRIQFTPFASATAYLQFAWGALWASLFGESFTVLRCATLTLSLASTLLAYALLRAARVSQRLALFGAAALLFHPLFFWASFTSMTHVPFVCLSLVAALMFVRAWEREGVWLAIAFAATVASFFTRQFAILNALAPLVVALMYRRKRVAFTYATATIVFALLVVTRVLVASEKELVLHKPSASGLLLRGVHYIFFNWQNAALFFAPLFVLVLLARVRMSRMTLIVAALLFAFPAYRMTAIVHMPIPYLNSGNVFTDFGLGPPTLRDVFTFGMRPPFALPFAVKLALMIVTTIGAVVAASVTAPSVRIDDALTRYCVAYLAIGTAIVAAMKINFDRYSVDTAWPFGILLVLLASRMSFTRETRAIAAMLLAVMIVFATSGTAEYLAWNRARWQAFSLMRAHGVQLTQMDGGYEINS